MQLQEPDDRAAGGMAGRASDPPAERPATGLVDIALAPVSRDRYCVEQSAFLARIEIYNGKAS